MILAAIAEAQAAGARLEAACAVAGLSARTVQRWRAQPDGDDCRCGPHHSPSNALSNAERARVIEVMTSPMHAGLSPKQLVPKLADKGRYLASESTMYRLRRQIRAVQKRQTPDRYGVAGAALLHSATGPNQVWSWDITYLRTTVRGRFFYLYLMMDVWSRRIVGWEVHTRESADHAARLMQRICDDEGIDPAGLVLHSDNGKPMRGATMLATLQWLGVVPSFSRPHVSNDNPYSEALFRTLKQAPAYPSAPFPSLHAARRWVERFVSWYNEEHHHSAIRFVTPNQRHFGEEASILSKRRRLYEQARRRKPNRWSGPIRDWSPVGAVELNPEPELKPRTAGMRQLP